MRTGHAKLLCLVPTLSDDLRGVSAELVELAKSWPNVDKCWPETTQFWAISARLWSTLVDNGQLTPSLGPSNGKGGATFPVSLNKESDGSASASERPEATPEEVGERSAVQTGVGLSSLQIWPNFGRNHPIWPSAVRTWPVQGEFGPPPDNERCSATCVPPSFRSRTSWSGDASRPQTAPPAHEVVPAPALGATHPFGLRARRRSKDAPETRAYGAWACASPEARSRTYLWPMPCNLCRHRPGYLGASSTTSQLRRAKWCRWHRCCPKFWAC